MSTTVDERVVSMRFDNQNFEKNVSTTMSTLDKLKEKLHLNGATKGLQDVNAAAGKVNMSGLGSAVETVSTKFSALQVMGVTALANITNSAVNAGKRMIKALTLDPVTTGFKEYETQINATQTILANTKSKGSTIDDVNKALEELNKYADMTIYNFTEMTRNIGTFTAAGIDLETSVGAIQGIANLAAVSGSTSQQASTAMYQLSQALSSGTVRLMDWNSVVNAGMGGEVFQNALKQTSRELETGADAAIEASGSFRESLKSGWLTADVLTETLKKFTTSGANEYVAQFTGLTVEAIAAEVERAKATGDSKTAIDRAAESIANMSGASKDAIKEALEFAETATDAATKVKTFTQLWDVLKEAAQSGWSQTWKIIVGDFEQAKSLLTPLADFLTGFINKMSDARNRVLEVALNFTKPWAAIMDKLGNVKKVISEIGKVTDTLEYFQDVVFRVWMGDYNNEGDNPDRRDLLKAAGYDARVVQYLVNKGLYYKLTIEDIEEAHAKFGLTMSKTTEETENVVSAIENLTDEKLRDAGLTEDEIRLYRALEKEADRLGISINDLANEMSTTNGRDLLIESVKNIGDIFVGVGKAAKDAWTEIFNPPSLEETGVRLYGVIRSLKDFTEKLRLTDKETGELNETGKKVKRTLRGVFAILNIITTIIGGGLRIALKVVSGILKYFNLDILSVTAAIGDAAVKLKEWFDSLFDISWILDSIVPAIDSAATAISNWFNAFKTSEGVTKAIEIMNDFVDSIKEWWAVLGESENIPKTIAEGIVNFFTNIPGLIRDVCSQVWTGFKESFSGAKLADTAFGGFIESARYYLGIAGQTFVELGKILLEKLNTFLSARGFREISEDSIAGLVEGLKSGVSRVWNAAVEIAKSVLESVKSFLGIHSPSTEFMEVGKNVIDGFILGIRNAAGKLLGYMKDLGGKLVETIKNIDFGTVLAGVIGVGMTIATVKIAKAAEGFVTGFGEIGSVVAEGLANTFVGTTRVLNSFSKVLKGMAMESIGKTIKDFAIALGILVAAIIALAYVCSDDRFDVWEAIGVVAALSAVLMGIAAVASLLGKAAVNIGKDGVKINNLMPGLISIGAALLMVALTAKLLGNMDAEAMKRGFQGIAGAVLAIVAVLAACKFLVKGDMTGTASRVGKTVLQIGLAMLVLAVVAKMIAKMEWDDMGKAIIGMSGLVLIISSLIIATKLAGPHANKVGGTMLKIGLAMGILVAVAKMIAGMEWSEMGQAAVGMLGFTGIIALLILATKLAGNNTAKIATTMLGISTAIMAMAFTVKMLGGMDLFELVKGTALLTIFSGIIIGLISATKLAGANAGKIALTMLGVAVAIGAMGLAVALLGILSLEHLAKGLVAVGLMSAMISAMIMATKNARNAKNSLIGIAIVIAVLTASLVALSLIDDPKKLIAPLASMITIMGMLALVISSLGKARKANKAIGPLIALSGIILILAGVIFAMCYFMDDMDKAVKASAAISLVVLTLAGVLFVISKIKIGLGLYAAIGTLGIFSFILLEIGKILSIVSEMKIGDVKPALESILTVLVVLTVVLAALSGLGVILSSGGTFFAGAGLAIAIAGLAALGLVVLELGWVLSKINAMDLSNAETNIEILSVLLITLTIILVPLTALGLAGTAAINSVVALAALGLVVLELGWVLSKINAMDLSNAAGNIVVLSMLLYVLTDILTPLTILGIAGPIALNSVVAIAALGLVVWELGAILNAMRDYKISDALPTVMVITILLKAMTEALIPLTILGIFGPAALAGVAALGVLALELGLLMWGLSAIKDTETARANVNTVTTLLRTMTDVIVEVSAVGAMSAVAVGAIAALTFLVGKMGILLAAIGALTSLFGNGVEQSLEKGINIFKIVAKGLGEIVSSFLEGLTSNLDTIANNLSAFAIRIMPFVMVMSTIKDSVAKGAGNLAKAVVAILAADFISAITNLLSLGGVNLPSLAEDLSAFGIGVTPFMEAMSGLDASAISGVEALCSAINSLTNANIKDAIVNLLPGDNSLGNFGENISAFATCIKDAAIDLAGITDEDVKNIKRSAEAGTALAELNKAIPAEGGLWQKIAGSKDLSSWGSKIAAFADCIVMYSDKVTGNTIDSDAIKKSTDAATNLSTLNDNIPRDGGYWQEIAGAKDLSDWGDKIVAFADTLILYSNKISGSNIDTEAIKNSAGAAEALAVVNQKIPTDGGLWQQIAGGKDITAFGAGLSSLANGILDYANTAVQIDDTKIAAISKTGDAIDKIEEVSEKLPDTGGVWGKLWGEKDPASFGQGVTTLATGIKDCVDISSTITDDKVVSISKMSDAIVKITEVFNDVPTVDSENVIAFKVAVNDLKSACSTMNSLANSNYDFTGLENVRTGIRTITTFLQNLTTAQIVSDYNDLETAVTKAAAISDMLTGLKTSYPGVDALKTAVTKLSELNVETIVDAFDGKDESIKAAIESIINALNESLANSTGTMGEIAREVANAIIDAFKEKYEDAKTSGIGLVTALKEGFNSLNSTIYFAGTTVGNMAAIGARMCYNTMKDAGKYLVDGFAYGIELRTWAAKTSAKKMAEAAINEAKVVLDINSPSKVFRAIGYSVPEGFAMGIDKMSGMVTNASSNMSNSAIDNVKSSISRIADLVNTDIDAQPTIRPVLDLSDVRSGVGTIGSLLSGTNSIGIQANIGAISSMMGSRSQNGVNTDVVSAIDKLRKDLGNINSNSYSINGINVSEGSDAADAIHTLVRVIKMEGRS